MAADDVAEKIWNGAVTAFLAVTLGVVAIMWGLVTPYNYWVGTPARAAVDHCVTPAPLQWDRDSSPDTNCTGTWRVDGHQQSGPIEPPFRETDATTIRPGKSTLDVRVRDGVAYSSRSVGKQFYIGLIFGAGVLGWGSFRLWRLRSRRHRAST
jgi:hypothetical protein